MRDAPLLPPPWTMLKLHLGGTVLLSGNAGSGKTSILLKIEPTCYETSEQEPDQVAQSWYRIHGHRKPAPRINAVTTWEDLEQDIAGIGEDDIVVVDSVSQLVTSHESTRLMKRMIERIRRAHARAFFVAQYTKAGGMLGPNELRHQVDVIADIPDDRTGLRRLNLEKNRFGNLTARYFDLGEEGVGDQDFPYAYSVEGSAGKYRLHLYPLAGAKLGGVLEALCEAGCRMERLASAAIACPAYPFGFANPPDVRARQIFAEEHGLTWITPQAAATLIAERAQHKEDF